MNDPEKQSQFINFLEKYGITPGNILLVCLTMWLTAVAVRGVIFWSVYHGKIPAIFVHGYHIHHFITGFLLLTISIILLSKKILYRYIPLTLIGCSMGLIFDETLYWTRGHFNYWSQINLAAVILIGTAMMIAYLFAKRFHLGGQISKKRVAATLLPVLAFSSILYLLFHYQNLLNPTYAQQDQNNKVQVLEESGQ